MVRLKLIYLSCNKKCLKDKVFKNSFKNKYQEKIALSKNVVTDYN